jgi:dienelactone hydrolase
MKLSSTFALLSAAALLWSGGARGQTPAVVKETSAGLAGFEIYRPADLGGRRGPAPVVVWGNGACSLNHTPWLPIIERLAGEGYVVLATGQALPSRAPPAPSDPRYTDRDIERAVEWAVRENGVAASPYAGRLDLGRIAATGNSCGGITSLAVASRNSHVKSVFVLTGSSAGPGTSREAVAAVVGKITAPVMYVVGGKEDIARVPASLDYELLPAGVPSLIVARSAGDHVFISGNPEIVGQAAEMVSNWLKATLQGDKAAMQTLKTRICSTCSPDLWSVEKSKNLD